MDTEGAGNTPPPAEPGPTASGGAGAGRASRRQQRRRRTIILSSIAAAVAVLLMGGAVAMVTRSDDSSKTTTTTHPPVTAPSTTTTPSTVPVPTTAVPRSTNPAVALAQQYDGRYTGTFTNTTFHTTGPTTLELRIDPATGNLTMDADFDGDVFGGGAKEVRRFSGVVTLGNANAPITTQTKAFGPVTGKLGDGLSVVLTAADVPDPKVKSFELIGRLAANNAGFDATYTVTFEDGSTAAGTATLACDPQGNRGSDVTTICTPR